MCSPHGLLAALPVLPALLSLSVIWGCVTGQYYDFLSHAHKECAAGRAECSSGRTQLQECDQQAGGHYVLVPVSSRSLSLFFLTDSLFVICCAISVGDVPAAFVPAAFVAVCSLESSFTTATVFRY